MQRLLRWLEAPIQLSLWIALIAGFLMMIHVTADVTGRYVFNRPLDGTTEIVSAYYMVVVAYLPWAFVARHDNHIAADIFTRLFPPRLDYWVAILVKILTILYVSIFVWQTASQAIGQFRIREVWQAGTGFIAVWPMRWLPPVAGGLMLIYLVARVIADVAAGPPDRRKAEQS
jgi:TRAP-type C4-dicarboxylate transport system permease small subunit